MSKNMISLIAAFALVLSLIFSMSPAKAASQPDPDNLDVIFELGNNNWLNVRDQLTRENAKDRYVLLDFWTYGCINCMQVVPEIEALETKFGPRLLVIGVHSAKFDAEKGKSRIADAARRFGLKHPVLPDDNFKIWNLFGVKAWPTLVLLDPQGNEISRYEGEGHQADLDRDLTRALKSSGGTDIPEAVAIPSMRKEEHALWYPSRIAAGQKGFYVADAGHNRILGLDSKGNITVKIGAQERGFEDGDFAKASFNNPRGLVVLGQKIYVADTGNHALREIDLVAKKVTTLAGTGKRGFVYDADKVPAAGVALASPWDLDVMADGKTLVIAMAGLHQLWSYDTAAKTLSVLAGTGDEKLIDGPAMSAALSQPSGVSVAGDAVYFVDAESSSLRRLENGEVKTLIGTGLFDFGDVDGLYPNARMQHPQGLMATPEKIWIADTYNDRVKIYDVKSGQLNLMAISGSFALSEPGDILLHKGQGYIVNTNGHEIIRFDPSGGQGAALPLKPDEPSQSVIR